MNVPIYLVEDFGFNYPQSDYNLKLDGTFSINQGECVLIQGASGSGKSTLLAALKGLIPHLINGKLNGKILYKNQDITILNEQQLLDIGYLQQNPDSQLLCKDVYSELAFGLENQGFSATSIDEKITVSEVGKRVWSNIGRLTIASVVFIFTLILVLTVAVLIGVGFVSMIGAVAGVLLALLLIFGMIIYTPVLAYFIPAAFFVVVRDGDSIFSSMGKVRKYLSGNFWWTWLIMTVAIISLGILQMLFNLPASIVSMMSTFSRISSLENVQPDATSNVLLLVFYTLGMFLTYCTSSISHLISAFNFMSHEEQHEGKGLMSRIDEIN